MYVILSLIRSLSLRVVVDVQGGAVVCNDHLQPNEPPSTHSSLETLFSSSGLIL